MDIDVEAAKDSAAEIVLKKLTPFEDPTSPTNYFSGAPQLPADMNWPCREDGYPLGFLFQIDCGTLARSVRMGGAVT